MFTIDSSVEEYILSEFSKIISPSDFEQLSTFSGFNAPNNFSYENLAVPLTLKKFPKKDHYEYVFALNESSDELLSLSNDAFIMYLCAIYIYCDKIRASGITMDSQFYSWVIELAHKSNKNTASILFVLFLEWLYDYVPNPEGYDNYFSIFAWLYMQRIIQQCDQAQFEKVANVLSKKNYSAESIKWLSDESDPTGIWVALNAELPEVFGYNREFFEKILRPENGRTVINNKILASRGHTMYFWKTNKLVEDLKNNSLSESNYKNYYLATSIVALAGYYLVLLEPPTNVQSLLFEAIGSITVTIIGINIAFNSNGGDNGIQFMNRIVSISFPLLIKVIVASLFLGFGLAVMEAFSISEQHISWFFASSIVSIQIVYFWRIAVHLKRISKEPNLDP